MILHFINSNTKNLTNPFKKNLRLPPNKKKKKLSLNRRFSIVMHPPLNSHKVIDTARKSPRPGARICPVPKQDSRPPATPQTRGFSTLSLLLRPQPAGGLKCKGYLCTCCLPSCGRKFVRRSSPGNKLDVLIMG